MAETHHPNYKKIYLTLLVLLVISIAGPFIGIGWVTLITAFGIALVKADMVVQNFMHLKWEKPIIRYVLGASVLLMILFYGAVATDVQKHEGKNWSNDAAKAAVARGIPGAHHEGAAPEEAAPETAAAPGPETAPAAAAPEAPKFDAAGAFATSCSPCHGAGGAGDGAAAAALNPKPANFTDPAFWSSRGDAEVFKAIREGGAAVGRSASMPPWGTMLDSTKTAAMVAYLHTLKK
jgi:caa(3)-type oxidase subunit IV